MFAGMSKVISPDVLDKSPNNSRPLVLSFISVRSSAGFPLLTLKSIPAYAAPVLLFALNTTGSVSGINSIEKPALRSNKYASPLTTSACSDFTPSLPIFALLLIPMRKLPLDMKSSIPVPPTLNLLLSKVKLGLIILGV